MCCPFAAGRLNELASWDDVKLLTVKVDRLREWARAGLLCIGDAAHAMSPVGGVGINLAIQDAVAAANILAGPLHEGRLTLDELRAVQRRRMFPTRVTQAVQVFVQRRVIAPMLGRGRHLGAAAAETVEPLSAVAVPTGLRGRRRRAAGACGGMRTGAHRSERIGGTSFNIGSITRSDPFIVM